MTQKYIAFSLFSFVLGFAFGAIAVVNSVHDESIAAMNAGNIGMWEQLFDRETYRLELASTGEYEQILGDLQKSRSTYAQALVTDCLEISECRQITPQKAQEIREAAKVR